MLKRSAMWAVPLLFVGVLFAWPLINILQLGLTGNWLQSLAEQQTLDAVWFTIWQALVSTLICLVLGVPGAYLLYRKSFAGQKLLRALVTVPLVLPTIVVAIAFVGFRDLPAIWLIILAHVFINYSITVRSVGGVWAGMDFETEEAAALAGAGRLRILWSISLPQLRPAVVSAASLTFLFCATSFGIILVLGGGLIRSIETEISVAALQFLDLPKAAALALIQTLLTVLAFTVSERFAKGAIGLEQVDEGGQKPGLDKRDWLAVLVSVAPIAGLIGWPIAQVIVKAFTFNGVLSTQNFENLATRGERDLLNLTVAQAAGNSLRNALIAAAISMTIGTLVAYLLSRPKGTKMAHLSNRALDTLFLLPMGVSSVVLGFGYLISFGGGPLPLRSSWLIVPLVQALMATPLVIRLIYPALISIGSEQREAAATDGASAAQTWWLIETPMIRGVIATAAGFALVVSIGEFGAASLLAYGDQATLPTILYALISRPGPVNYGMAMAVCALLILLTLILVLAVSFRGSNRTQRQP